MPDTNYVSYADIEDLRLEGEQYVPICPQYFDDTLKFSHVRNARVKGIYVLGGRENAVDINRMCRDICIEDSTLKGGDQATVVVKGGSESIIFDRVIHVPSPKAWCEFLLGDWSDQSTAKTRGVVIINNRTNTDQPVRVVVGRADWPEI